MQLMFLLLKKKGYIVQTSKLMNGQCQTLVKLHDAKLMNGQCQTLVKLHDVLETRVCIKACKLQTS